MLLDTTTSVTHKPANSLTPLSAKCRHYTGGLAQVEAACESSHYSQGGKGGTDNTEGQTPKRKSHQRRLSCRSFHWQTKIPKKQLSGVRESIYFQRQVRTENWNRWGNKKANQQFFEPQKFSWASETSVASKHAHPELTTEALSEWPCRAPLGRRSDLLLWCPAELQHSLEQSEA